MIEGRNGVEQMIRQKRKERGEAQEQIKKLYERYEDLEAVESMYQKKREEFEDHLRDKRQCATKIAHNEYSPNGIKKFADCLGEKLYGNDYKRTQENMTMFYEEILKEKEQLIIQMEAEEQRRQQLDEKIRSLERLMI